MHHDRCSPNISMENGQLPLDLPEGVPPLRSFFLYLTTGCNLCCRHCWITPTFVNGQQAPGDFLNIDLLKDAVTEAKPMGLFQAKLTGGEPTLHPQFAQIVDVLTAEGMRMDMETNATLIDAPLARHLKKNTNVWFVSVSLDSADPESHDRFRRVPGAFEAAVRGIKHLVDAGYQPQVIMSPYRGNVDEIKALVELAVSLGAGSVKFNPVTRTGRGIAMHEQGEALDYEEILQLVHFVYDVLQDQTPIPLMIIVPPALLRVGELLRIKNGGGACHVRHILGLLGTGEMALCGIGRNIPELCFGNLGKDTIRDVWIEHPTLKQLRQDLKGPYPGICGECIHAPRCLTHCVAQNYMENKKLVWPSFLCAEAERRGEFPRSRRRSLLNFESEDTIRVRA